MDPELKKIIKKVLIENNILLIKNKIRLEKQEKMIYEQEKIIYFLETVDKLKLSYEIRDEVIDKIVDCEKLLRNIYLCINTLKDRIKINKNNINFYEELLKIIQV